MTQKIDPARLKAAAEHLEWVCQQYPNEERVQSLLEGLRPMIEDAKAGRVLKPILDSNEIPSSWAVSGERLFDAYKAPNIESAYVAFADEMKGGLTEQDRRILARMKAHRDALSKGDQS